MAPVETSCDRVGGVVEALRSRRKREQDQDTTIWKLIDMWAGLGQEFSMTMPSMILARLALVGDRLRCS